MKQTRRGALRLAAYGAVLGACIVGVLAVTAAVAASRDQAWYDVASDFNSRTWYSPSKGTHTFYRYTCSDNHPVVTYTATFMLRHQRGGWPDENEGVMQSYACTGTNRSGSAYSDETENHYWNLTYNHGGDTWVRVSGTGRQYYPG
jgi:hypothetical protein